MATGSKKILEERLTAFEGMKSIMDKISRGERLSVEERADFDARNLRISELDADLRTAREAEKLAETMRADTAEVATPEIHVGERRAAAFTEYMRSGMVTPELRSMGTGSLGPSTAGSTPGYLVPPGWWQRLQIALKAYGGIANDFQTMDTDNGQSIQWATNNPTTVIGQFVAENTSTASVDYTFGQGTLSAYMMMAGPHLVSIQLAQDSAFDIDGFVQDRVGESIGRGMAQSALTGTGSSQPLGILKALQGAGAASIGTGGVYTVSTASGAVNVGAGGQTATAANVPGLADIRGLISSVDPAYRAQGAKFYFNDAQLLGLRTMVDGNGRPLINLQDGLSQGTGTSLLGYEVVVDNNIPNLSTTAATGGPVFGHLQSAMVLRRVKDVALMRLDQRYAEFLQIGFIGYFRFDIRSNDLRAAACLQGGSA